MLPWPSGRRRQPPQEASPPRPAEPSWELAPGDEIAPGRQVVEILGGGRDVEVFLVWDSHLFALAVAKVLRPHRVENPRSRAHLEREGELARRLAHPGLGRGYELRLEGRYPHLLLEYVEGPTLRRLVRRHGPLAEEQWLPFAAQMAAVLQYLANEEVVHLDIKPANLVLGLSPRLIDLGIARPFEAARRLRDVIGTASWMAPEQCDPVASGGVGPAADIWGLGATLYYALSGERPFPAHAPGGAFPQLERAPKPLPSHLPVRIRGLVMGMLSRTPSARPRPLEIAEALEPLLPPRRKRSGLTPTRTLRPERGRA